jgi:type VI secretion system secreted protein Hcp
MEERLRRKNMATDVFMKIDGIAGESLDLQFKDWIEVLSLNWEVERTVGHTNMSDHDLKSSQFGIIKVVDKATPLIFKAITTHQNIPKIEVAFCRAGKEKVKYLEYVFEKCAITKAALQMANNSGESLPTENIEFRFASVAITYCQQKRSTGGSAGQLAHVWVISERG